MSKLFANIWTSIRHLFERLLIAFWRRVAPVKTPQPTYSTALADNLQMHMNLVMPLADQTPVGRARAAQAIAANIDELFTGLSNVGTVHFARFDLIGGNLCMYSVFDGDFRAYIRDFICVFGSVFDSLLGLVADPPPSPSALHPEAFIDWIHRHDSFQIPRDLTSLFPEEKNLKNLSRDLVLLLDENPNVQLGRFSGYPGISVAQIRHGTGLGW
ncbi:MAG: hypothetical protein NT015_17605 [Alphaproteobacteria bacterium]|nr:hypothetical protein [Alphaproteobacteria bacterium]